MPKVRCRHTTMHNDCEACLRRAIRDWLLDGVVCAICERTGHTARYCQVTKVGRSRLGYGGPPAHAREASEACELRGDQ